MKTTRPAQPTALRALAVAAILAHVPLLVPATAADLTVSPPLLLDGLAAGGGQAVFSWAGDLWAVPLAGGEAQRLTAGSALDAFPAVSPDGSAVAFSRLLAAGNWDVFTVPLAGGEPRRLTWHPKLDWVRGWTGDGTVLFATSREGDHLDRLYTVAAAGGFPEPLPVPRGHEGSLSTDGRLAYVPWSIPYEVLGWTHYRGGLTSPLRLADLRGGEDRELLAAEANHRNPVWIGETLFFRSDATGAFEVYALDPRGGGEARRLTLSEPPGADLLAVADGTLVFVRDGRLHHLDPADGTAREVPVTLRVDAPERAPRRVPATEWIQSVAVGSGGALVLGARGEALLAAPSEDARGGGDAVRNLTGTPDAAERDPVATPDGSSIALFSDRSGEYRLEVRSAADGTVEKTLNVEAEPSFYRELTVSPDGRHAAFSDIRLALWLADLESGDVRRIDRSSYMAQGEFHPRWSPDGRYLAYAKALPNRLRAVFVHDTRSGRTHQVTDGTTHAEHPVFDRGGRYLAFVSSSDARLAAADDIGWGLLSSQRARPLVTRAVHLAVLREGDPSPFVAPAPARGEPYVEIDFEGLAGRIVPFPSRTAIRDWVGLEAGPPGVLLARAVSWPVTPGDPGRLPTPLLRLGLAPDAADPVELVPDVDGFTVSADGTRLAFSAGGRWGLAGTAGAVDVEAARQAFEDALGGATIAVDPAAEWRQMYQEVWRQARDAFYDPGHHGQDVAALEAHYADYLPGIVSRAQLNGLFRTMLGRLSVSHLRVGGGDVPETEPEAPPVGVLGVDFELRGDRYRFRRILRSVHFSHLHPLLRPPLADPGVGVREGDSLLAVDGEEVTAARSVFSYFSGKVNRPVELTVARDPEGNERRTVTVVPRLGFGSLRKATWAEERRRRVEELSGGRLGYVHVGAWGGTGMDDFYRALLGLADREGLVLDTRFNGGGTTADFAVETLGRAPLYHYLYRHGEPFPVPPVAFPRPKVLLVNRWNFSAGETFPLMWQLAGLGPVVGTRTGGGGIGSALFQRTLLDGGEIGIPNRAAFDPAGSWTIENRGVVPDLEVEVTPADEAAGRDPQLEAAVRLALEAIDGHRPPEVVRPPFPKHPAPANPER